MGEAAMSCNVDVNEELLDEQEDLRLDAVAQERLMRFELADAVVSHEEMRVRYAKED
jgi:antitoxin StbD